MSERRVPVRFAGDEHELVAAEAARAGQSLSRFIARAALARAAYLRARAGDRDPFERPPKEERAPVTYDEVIAIALANVGQRLRVTAPNGFQTVGVVGTWRNRSSGEVHPTLDNRLMSREYDGMAAVEVMGANWRYRPAGPA